MNSGMQTFAMALLVMLGMGSGSNTGLAQAAPDVVAITGATLFDATGRLPYRATVIIRDGRIAEIGPDVAIPAGARIVKADGKALLPGFFDVHTHWSPGGEPGTIPQIASSYVAAGVTTVNDFHQQPESFAPRRAWLAELTAPHVNFVARMSTPGGHGADWADTNTTKWVATAGSARREVQALQPYRPDFIKAFADGWRYGMSPDNTSMNLATLSALVDEAHKNGQRVLTHTVTVERGKDAGRAKVDVIAHSLQDREIDAEAVRLIKEGGTFYAPTLAIYEPVKPGATKAPDMGDPVVQQRFRKFGYARHNLKALYDAGVPIALGTDSGIEGAPHGTSTLHEMELMVDAGLSPEAALIAGTANSARSLGLDADRGTIEKGKRADLVLIAGAPWADIRDVRKVDRVLIDGRLVYGPGIALPAANRRTALAPVAAEVLIDDFERADGRSSTDTLRLADMDGGTERSVVLTTRVPHAAEGHALLITARMAQKEKPEAGVIIPFRRGSVQPVDATRFRGVRLELRGEGPYLVTLNTLAGAWQAKVTATPQWREVALPFSAFEKVQPAGAQATPWRGDDLLQIAFELSRPAGENAWGEVDNVRFY